MRALGRDREAGVVASGPPEVDGQRGGEVVGAQGIDEQGGAGAIVGAIGAKRPHEQLGAAVAVAVVDGGQREAGPVVGGRADEAQVGLVGSAGPGVEHDEQAPGPLGRAGGGDHQIGEPVGVQVEARERVSEEFRNVDRNGDGYLSPAEVEGRLPGVAREFAGIDRDGDRRLSLDEFITFRRLQFESRRVQPLPKP